MELEERQGYGFALRHALYHEVSTPYVCVIQHDRTFMRRTPMDEVVRSMMNKRNGDIKYVGINMRSNLTYRDIFNSKYGKEATAELIDMVIYPPELNLDSKVYGPHGSSAAGISAEGRIRKNLQSLAKSYLSNIQMRSHTFKNVKDGKHQLSLTPTLFWYDNTHIVETAHYRDYIFNPTYRMVARGGFVEDKVSPIIIRNVERLGLKEGHAKFKCYLLDDHSGYFFTGHIDGGSYMSASERNKVSKIRNGDAVW